jgi:DNA polymerase III subunit gamma/tau
MAAESQSHLVLARKWRPERFEELVGQEHVTRTLIQALKTGRIAHAFLFTGIRGVGKTTAARILARCLNCEKGPTAEPCGECAACIEIRAGRALDVVEIDGATYRKIDDARAIIENLSYRPARDRFKIYIIDEAHQLTDQAFNALLKTLEEPPAHVKFILATTEPQKMPETILSRLQRYDFRRIPLATIVARLKELVSREGAEAEDGALRLIAREAGGSMRDAERTLETAIATSGGKVIESEVATALGVASRTAVYRIIEAVLNKDGGVALKEVRELHSRGANLESLGRDILEALRNLAVAKLPASDGDTPLADLPDHEAAELGRLAKRATSRDLMRLFRLMAESQEEILRTPYPDLIIEMAVVRMATLAPVMDADELLRAIGVAEAGAVPPAAPRGGAAGGAAGSGGGARRIPMAGEVKADAPRRAADVGGGSAAEGAAPAANAGQASATEVPAMPPTPDLPDLRDHIRMRRAALAGFMEHGAALALEGDVLRVTALSDIYVRYLADNVGVLADLASEKYGRRIRAELIANGGGVVSASRGASAPRLLQAPTRPTALKPTPHLPRPSPPTAGRTTAMKSVRRFMPTRSCVRSSTSSAHAWSKSGKAHPAHRREAEGTRALPEPNPGRVAKEYASG